MPFPLVRLYMELFLATAAAAVQYLFALLLPLVPLHLPYRTYTHRKHLILNTLSATSGSFLKYNMENFSIHQGLSSEDIHL